MDGVSVYSGQDAFFEVSGLSGKRCYVFRVAAYGDGVWTKFSDPLRVAASTAQANVKKVDQMQVRNEGKKQRSMLCASCVGGVCSSSSEKRWWMYGSRFPPPAVQVTKEDTESEN